LSGILISSRDWDEVESNTTIITLGTGSQGQKLHTPMRGFSAFIATFKVMFKEEFRKNIEFAKARQVILFPLLLSLVTMISTIGLQFLVGDSAAQTSDIESKTFTWQELRFGLHLP